MPNPDINQISITKQSCFAKGFALTADERVALFESFFLLPLAALMLRFCGMRWTRNALTPRRALHSELPLSGQLEIASKISRMVEIAAQRGLYKANCLKRSLVLFRLLRRRGFACELIFGAQLENQGFSAHAWVELEGILLNDQAHVREKFSVFHKQTDAKSLLSTPPNG